jgi:glutamate dehydrogenase (NADP+)
VPCQLAFPCATQNEVTAEDARNLITNGVLAIVEGANMPCTPEATALLHAARVCVVPGKAANAGGVAVSGLEQSQNALRISWPRAEVDARLRAIVRDIHKKCLTHGRQPDGLINYSRGANIAGFLKVAEAMLAYGIV